MGKFTVIVTRAENSFKKKQKQNTNSRHYPKITLQGFFFIWGIEGGLQKINRSKHRTGLWNLLPKICRTALKEQGYAKIF